VIEATLVTEAKAARETAALADRLGRGLLSARGKDRLAFLHAMLSQSVKDLTPGHGCRAELLDDRGHVVADFRVLVLADEVRLACDTPAIAAKAFAALDKFIIMDDVQLADTSGDSAVLTLSGRNAGALLLRCGAGSMPSGVWSSAAWTIGSEPVLLVAAKWTGGGDYDIHLSAGSKDAVRTTLLAAGATPIAGETFTALRIEAGIATQTDELDDVLALEANLAPEAVSFTKGCYLGQEVMARIDARGHVNRVLVGLTLDGEAPAVRGSILRVSDKDVGRITSSAISPALGKPIALAYLRREHSTPGTAITVRGESGERPAIVAALPFVL